MTPDTDAAAAAAVPGAAAAPGEGASREELAARLAALQASVDQLHVGAVAALERAAAALAQNKTEADERKAATDEVIAQVTKTVLELPTGETPIAAAPDRKVVQAGETRAKINPLWNDPKFEGVGRSLELVGDTVGAAGRVYLDDNGYTVWYERAEGFWGVLVTQYLARYEDGRSALGEITWDVQREGPDPGPGPVDPPPPGKLWPKGLKVPARGRYSGSWHGNGTGFLVRQGNFCRWRGDTLDEAGCTMAFIGLGLCESWDSLTSNRVVSRGGAVEQIARAGLVPVLNLPPFPKGEARRWDLVRQGDFDGHYRTLLGNLKASLQGRWVFLRPAHECTRHGHYHWGIERDNGSVDSMTRENFVPGYRHFCEVIRDVLGDRIVVTQNFLKRPVGDWNHADFVAGKPWIDAVGVDPYDTDGESQGRGDFWGDHVPGRKLEGPLGFAKYARAEGLMLAFCEWGTSNKDESASSPANNGEYTRKLVAVMEEYKDVMLYENYFNQVDKHQIWPDAPHNPKVRDAYLEAFARR